jgi:hypothetical protein
LKPSQQLSLAALAPLATAPAAGLSPCKRSEASTTDGPGDPRGLTTPACHNAVIVKGCC